MWFSRRSPSNIMMRLLGMMKWYVAVATCIPGVRKEILLSEGGKWLPAARDEVGQVMRGL
jgi:hypothetical protein